LLTIIDHHSRVRRSLGACRKLIATLLVLFQLTPHSLYSHSLLALSVSCRYDIGRIEDVHFPWFSPPTRFTHTLSLRYLFFAQVRHWAHRGRPLQPVVLREEALHLLPDDIWTRVCDGTQRLGVCGPHSRLHSVAIQRACERTLLFLRLRTHHAAKAPTKQNCADKSNACASSLHTMFTSESHFFLSACNTGLRALRRTYKRAFFTLTCGVLTTAASATSNVLSWRTKFALKSTHIVSE
jgi:hypothetical protein